MTLLLLAGTGEAREIAMGLRTLGIDAIASLSGATRSPRDLGLETITGGFGGRAGFQAFLKARNITAIIDATHPFAARISHRTAQVAVDENVRYLQVLRPKWEISRGDRWNFVRDEAGAAEVIPRNATVFLATGRQTLAAFAGLEGRKLYCRQIDPPDGAFPFSGGQYLIGRPPFSVEDERKLFLKLQIDILVVKNAGGDASRTKLDAAREIGLQVVMIDRPAQPDAPRVETAQAALDWASLL